MIEQLYSTTGNCVSVKEIELTYYNKEARLFTIYPSYGDCLSPLTST